MAEDDEDRKSGQYASPPCYMHEVDPAYFGLDPDSQQSVDVARWRKAQRKRLIDERLAHSAQKRQDWGKGLLAHLEPLLGDVAGLVIGAYWPFRGEPDLRPLLQRLRDRGAVTALPVVAERGKPLIFRQWAQGDRLVKGVWNIPEPADGAEVIPQIVIAPVVGFDLQCYRLGYGGGYYDRTLASLGENPPRAIGVGYAFAVLGTIYPQSYDVPMDAIVTEKGLACQREV